ncbi:MAG: hypothetical protein M1834_001479 [Cirrosporium novae-zelandiae]|nr:MAG: hypothetical protein M1834_008615 [Cirrosporium novae-zelandiae]KAI9736013.1 MAG: hypothetical protein M1834_001479 [Cirrosporium novae-zelandiae]
MPPVTPSPFRFRTPSRPKAQNDRPLPSSLFTRTPHVPPSSNSSHQFAPTPRFLIPSQSQKEDIGSDREATPLATRSREYGHSWKGIEEEDIVDVTEDGYSAEEDEEMLLGDERESLVYVRSTKRRRVESSIESGSPDLGDFLGGDNVHEDKHTNKSMKDVHDTTDHEAGTHYRDIDKNDFTSSDDDNLPSMPTPREKGIPKSPSLQHNPPTIPRTPRFLLPSSKAFPSPAIDTTPSQARPSFSFHPHSTSVSTPRVPAQTPPRPSFILPPATPADTGGDERTLSAAFSPSRKAGYMPSGLASQMLSIILSTAQTGINMSTYRRRGPEGGGMVEEMVTLKVGEARTGNGIAFILDEENRRTVLIGQGSKDGKVVSQGERVGLRAPLWDVQLGDKGRWVVGVDWEILKEDRTA